MSYLHKFKCLHCNLHFIVCSYYEDWPNHQPPGAAPPKANVFCPECGTKNGRRLVFKEVITEEIYQHVPGNAQFMENESKLV